MIDGFPGFGSSGRVVGTYSVDQSSGALVLSQLQILYSLHSFFLILGGAPADQALVELLGRTQSWGYMQLFPKVHLLAGLKACLLASKVSIASLLLAVL